MKRMIIYLLMLGTLSLLPSCGGSGSGGGGSSEGETSPSAAVTKATLKLLSSGVGTIYGIDVTVILPEGVTVKSSSLPQVDAEAVLPSGAAANDTIATAVYTPATTGTPAKVRVLIANANGFTTGEFCSVNGDIASGHSPKAGDFTIESFSASDADGNVIAGITSGLTAEIR